MTSWRARYERAATALQVLWTRKQQGRNVRTREWARAKRRVRSLLREVAVLCVVAIALVGCSSSSQNGEPSEACTRADGGAKVAHDLALEFELTQLAAEYAAPGAIALGPAVSGEFQTGQTLESQAELAAGKCYTAVGAGSSSVSELNVKLVAVSPIPGSAMVLAADQDTGPEAVLGKDPNCYKNAFPMAVPVKVVLEVTEGCGAAAVQVYGN